MQALGFSHYTRLYTWVSASKQPVDLWSHQPASQPRSPPHRAHGSVEGLFQVLLVPHASLAPVFRLFLGRRLRSQSGRGGNVAVHRWLGASQDMCMSRGVHVAY
jgi:hypothetical protein